MPAGKKKPTTKPHYNGLHPGGRPPLYDDPELMQVEIDKYFDACDKGEEIEVYDKKKETVHKINKKTPYTVPGLVYALGFGENSALDWYKTKEEFLGTIRRAWKRIELQRNERALTGEQDPRFSQFDLINNFKWKKQEELTIVDESTHYTPEERDTLKDLAIERAKKELATLKGAK